MPDAVPESRNQFVVALAIVGAMGAIGLALIVAAVVMKNVNFALGGVGTIIGALATALNTPTGIGKVITAAKAPPFDAGAPTPKPDPNFKPGTPP